MAAGLTTGPRWLSGFSPRRRAAFALVTLLVLLVHGLATQRLAERVIDLDHDAAMPARIEVAYVRDMALAAPPPMAAPAAPAATSPRARPVRRVPRRPAMPASAAQTPDSAASSVAVATRDALEPPPDAQPVLPTSEPASSPDAAASAPAVDPSVVAEAPAASAASAPAFEWPASTRMSYLLTGNVDGPVEGSAQVEWIRIGAHYQVHLDLIVGPSFAPVVSRRMSSDGEITEQGLAPRRYDQQTRAFGTDRGRATILFDTDGVVLANGERQPAVPGVQDTASQFVQLTYVFSTRPDLLRVGGSVDIPLALPHKVDVWTYDVVEEELLATRFGPLPSIHLKPRRTPRPGTLTAEIWFAPQLRYLPVRILVRQDQRNFVDLLIDRKPQMSAQ